jgi:ABC-2 type transport system ATP-binding protein
LDNGEIQFVGKPEDLIHQAEGKIWSTIVQQHEITQMNQRYQVVQSVRVSEGWRIRLIADTAHIPNATPLPPTLEDGYMFLMREELEQAL